MRFANWLTALIVLGSWLQAQQDPRTYVCYKTPEPPSIDGLLDEACWGAVPWTEEFVDIEGESRPRPRHRTRAKMLWDDRHFYVAAEMEEPDLWATLTERDSIIYRDNDFEVFIDPDGDTHDYYELEVNAFNTVFDLFLARPYRDGGRALIAWDIRDLQTAVHLQGTLNDPSDRDQGWTVEMAIPWAVLKEATQRPAPPGEGDQWRVNFSRVQWSLKREGSGYSKLPGRKEDNWVWSPQGVINMHYPEMWGYVQFTRVELPRVPAQVDSTSGVPSGEPQQTVRFNPPSEAPLLRILREIYHRQRDYHRRHGRYSSDPAALGVEEHHPNGLKLQATDSLFEASLVEPSPAGRPARRWHIRQDSKTWSSSPPDASPLR